MNYAKVYINSMAYALDRSFDYEVPEGMRVLPGMRVEVPFGGRRTDGFVTDISDKTDIETGNIKKIAAVLDEMPVCSKLDMELAAWIRNRYFSSHYAALRLFMPPGSGMKFKETVTLINPENAENLTEHSTVPTSFGLYPII